MDYYLNKLRPLTLLFLRCNLALIFLYSGYHKYADGIPALEAYMKSLHLPSYFAYINLALELGGGALLVLGLGTRVVSLLLTVQMFIAVWSAHLGRGLSAVPDYQYQLLVGVAALVLVSAGAGSISLDHAFFSGGGRPKGKPRG